MCMHRLYRQIYCFKLYFWSNYILEVLFQYSLIYQEGLGVRMTTSACSGSCRVPTPPYDSPLFLVELTPLACKGDPVLEGLFQN